MVFGCGRSDFCVSKIISTERGAKVFFITSSVPCPFPVHASEPYRKTLKASASGWRCKKMRHARSGPIVCELDGPRPVLYIDFIDVMPPDRFLSSGLMFASFMIASQVECLGFYRGILLGGIGGVPPAKPKK